MESVLLKLIVAVRNNDAKTAEVCMSKWTYQEQEAIAYYLEETAQYLRRVSKFWKEAMNYPADNEE